MYIYISLYTHTAPGRSTKDRHGRVLGRMLNRHAAYFGRRLTQKQTRAFRARFRYHDPRWRADDEQVCFRDLWLRRGYSQGDRARAARLR